MVCSGLEPVDVRRIHWAICGYVDMLVRLLVTPKRAKVITIAVGFECGQNGFFLFK